jgi:DNA-binding transcriptional MerR regulator
MLMIGHVARLSGLTTKALRHYDAIGLLRPAAVDERTGYRRYTAPQVDLARLIYRLREVELPLDAIRALLPLAGDPGAQRDVLLRHRRRLDARITRLQRTLHRLDHLLDEEAGTAMTDIETSGHYPAEWYAADPERAMARELFNAVWTLLEKDDRSPDDDAEMIHAAHASTYHWSKVGTDVNRMRGEWQCSRVYATLGRAEQALYHARRTLDICERLGIGDFSLAWAYEAMARALAVDGNRAEADQWLTRAKAACADIADPADRELVESDLATVPMQ